MRGIYKITNTLDGTCYIGSSFKDTTNRCKQHKNHLKANRHPNVHLQRAWNKYGEEVFTFTHLLDYTGDDIHELVRLEEKILKEQGDHVYNILKECLTNPSLNENVKQKLRDKWNDEEYRTKMSEISKRNWNPERKEKWLARMKEYWANPENRKRVGENVRKRLQEPELKEQRIKHNKKIAGRGGKIFWKDKTVKERKEIMKEVRKHIDQEGT